MDFVPYRNEIIISGPQWISVKDQLPPKDSKFLFSYYYGVGLGLWNQVYRQFNGDSNREGFSYYLVLTPSDPSEGDETFVWDENKMIEMDVFWMPLPEPPK